MTYFILTRMPRVSLFPEACHHNTFNRFFFKAQKDGFHVGQNQKCHMFLYLAFFLSVMTVNWKQKQKKIEIAVKVISRWKKVFRHQKRATSGKCNM